MPEGHMARDTCPYGGRSTPRAGHPHPSPWASGHLCGGSHASVHRAASRLPARVGLRLEGDLLDRVVVLGLICRETAAVCHRRRSILCSRHGGNVCV